MKTLFLFLLPVIMFAQQNPILLGKINQAQLKENPYADWFTKGYESYTINPSVLADLKKISKGKMDVQIFIGTWCGDTRRELPRFIKILEEAGFTRKI